MRNYGLPRKKVTAAARRLEDTYAPTELGNRADPLEEAVFVLLSSQTDERKYQRAWMRFREAFPAMAAAAAASEQSIYEAIQPGGLGRWKAARIKRLIDQVHARFGVLSLDALGALPDAPLEEVLVSLDGVGVKTARCIMMYAFGRQVFPVDVHVNRILSRLGFRYADGAPRSRRYANAMQERVPPALRHRFHVNLLLHGREICRPRHPHCERCVLGDLCRYFRSRKR